MASTGYLQPNQASETVPFNMPLSLSNDAGQYKLGALIDFAGSVTAGALRYKTVSFNLNVNTQVTIAHNCKDSSGNAATPVFAVPLYSSGDGFFISQAPDATNIYLTAPAGATTAVTGSMVVFY